MLDFVIGIVLLLLAGYSVNYNYAALTLVPSLMSMPFLAEYWVAVTDEIALRLKRLAASLSEKQKNQ